MSERRFQRIGEVAADVGVATHVLRYWESEFPQLRPRKGSGGQRLYQKRDIELIREIKSLLHERGYTIEGARRALNEASGSGPGELAINRVLREINAISELLED
ncbi:MAG: MerR family transcriptional regulator [Candidatus Dadabacteria bacterium]|nr:MAG: MerR family transcriptional regulator [Candidatus Dadabacteria bacterium]